MDAQVEGVQGWSRGGAPNTIAAFHTLVGWPNGVTSDIWTAHFLVVNQFFIYFGGRCECPGFICKKMRISIIRA